MTEQGKQLLIWVGALAVGAVLGLLHVQAVDSACNFVATVYTRLFQFLAVPTVALAIMTTMIGFGRQKSTRKIFVRTLTYTLLTTFAAAFVGLGIYLLISPDRLPAEMIGAGTGLPEGAASFHDHIISVIPDNIVRPFLSGNVLSILLIAIAVGLAICFMQESERKTALVNVVQGVQEVFFILIRALIKTLPLGIAAFAAQLTAQLSGGIILGSLGKWAAVILLGNCIQFFVVLPLFLLIRGINPVRAQVCCSRSSC